MSLVNNKVHQVFLLFLLILSQSVKSLTILKADGVSDTYSLIKKSFGKTSIQVPDCNHTSFGPHITQIYDPSLNSYVFAFHSHINLDDDRCINFDRQRTEITSNDNVPSDKLTGHHGEDLTLSWNFKLDENFLPPYSFCHIHQLKAFMGDDQMPIITLTARRSHPDNLIQLIHIDSDNNYTILNMVPLQPWLGQWIHVSANIILKNDGRYSLQVTREVDNEILMSFAATDIDMWRNETKYVQPKWGLYRSLQERLVSRDEIILFNNFCISNGNTNTCS